MKDGRGTILYVGKAINLRKRVRAYFQRHDRHDPKTASLVAHVADIATVVTASEKEALILESTLIKRHRPRYNVVLKDDKRYPSLRVNIKEPYPRIEIVRRTPTDGALYFGPYASAQAVRQTVNLINKTFPLRKCSNRTMGHRSRPCIHFQMGQCLAPCCRPVDPTRYDDVVKEVILFLKGRTPELIARLRRHMLAAAENQDFENAAVLRDRMFALEKTLERQVTVTTDRMDRDVIGISGNSDFCLITVMTLRRGVLQGVRHFEFTQTVLEKRALIAQFLSQYYQSAHFIPAEILVPEMPENHPLVAETLSDWRSQRVALRLPQRGEKRRLLDMAMDNAANTLRERLRAASNASALLEALQQRLHMSRLPRRIECFDNSNLGGSHPVSAMAVFVNGRPHKAGYRRFAIRTVSGPDDYASMAEVLARRYARIGPRDPAPDLLMVDGGRGQLSIALAVLERMGLAGRFTVVGIAKNDDRRPATGDKIYLPNRTNPVNMGRDGRLLLLLQQIRDEAHRFAVAYHRKQRKRKTMTSALESVRGIGVKRRAVLLKYFGSLKQLRAATIEEISGLPGITPSMAEAIKHVLAD